LQIKIQKLVYGGDGLGRLPADENGPGKTVFAPFVLESETVEIVLTEQKRGFARGRVEEIVEASAHRVEPQCPYFQRCGGCHYQHADYAHQLEIKAEILRETLRRTAKIELPCELQTHSASPWKYRNRTRFKLRHAPEFAIGYYKLASHELQPVEQCPISSNLINRALTVLWHSGRAGKLAGIDEIELFSNADDTQMNDAQMLLELYIAAGMQRSEARRLVESVQPLIPEIAGVAAFSSGVAESQKPIAAIGSEFLTYATKRAAYRVSAGAFFQVNRFLLDELTSIVVPPGLSGSHALDLYAGVGLFSKLLAESFPQVSSVEMSQTSTGNLSDNCPENVEVVQATTEAYLNNANAAAMAKKKKSRPDLVIVDPPRAGLGESVVAGLVKLNSPRLTYVSCDPATLARDLADLTKAGYRIAEAHWLDMFPQTFHIESVFHLLR
jgi:23S rRNA (uracil1939-C5)-methyltransferase